MGITGSCIFLGPQGSTSVVTPHLPDPHPPHEGLARCLTFKPYPDSDRLCPWPPNCVFNSSQGDPIIPLLETLRWFPLSHEVSMYLSRGPQRPVLFLSSVTSDLYSHYTPLAHSFPCTPNTPGTFPPQGLCSSCSLGLTCSSLKDLQCWPPRHYWVFSQTSPSP